MQALIARDVCQVLRPVLSAGRPHDSTVDIHMYIHTYIYLSFGIFFIEV